MHSYVLLVLDSCRYDSMQAAWPTLQHIPKLGALSCAFSFSSWTFASHVLFAMGRLPWRETRADSSEQKTELDDLRQWTTRLGLAEDNPFREHRDLREGLHRLGYRLNAITSANPLTENSRFAGFVDDLVSVGQFENCLERAITKIDLRTPQYLIINVCETHYPYWDGAYDQRFSPLNLHGFAAQMRAVAEDRVVTIPRYDEALLSMMRLRQIESIRYVDAIIPQLYRALPSGTYLTITADHGDCFGEDGFVGHGEVWHKKVLEVPFLEGWVPSGYTA